MAPPWTDDNILSFIEAIRLRPELWDPEDCDYDDLNLKRNSWNAVATQFNITSQQAYKKFQLLRELTKNEHKTFPNKRIDPNGKAVTWFTFDEMKFIMSKDISDSSIETQNPREARSAKTSTVHMENTIDTQTIDQSELDEDFIFQPPSKIHSRKKRNQQNPYNNKVAFETAFHLLNKSNRKQNTQFSGFAEHVANKLSGYDNYTRSHVEFQISKILYEADMKMLRKRNELQSDDTLSSCSNATSATAVSAKENTLSPAASAESSCSNNGTDLTISGTSVYPSGTSSNYNTEFTLKVESHSKI